MKHRIASLDTVLATAFTGVAGGPSEDFRLDVKDSAPIAFSGLMLGIYSTNDARPRWSELRLYRTAAGAFIAERANRSANDGERDFIVADVVETVADAMSIFGYDAVGKGFARTLGWDIVRHVD